METILFVISLTAAILYFVKVVSVLSGNSMSVPAPLGHFFDVDFSNTYVYTSAIMYQVYFWATYFQIIGA